jgi:S-DNA-T family DNA segregation ATPase FtsK/SpoIIIE
MLIEEIKIPLSKAVKKEEKSLDSSSSPNILEELEQNRQLMDELERGVIEEPKDFILPHLEFLEKAPKRKRRIDKVEIDRKVHELIEKLSQFKISGEVMDIYSGPLVTTFEFKPAPDIKVSKILNLQDDLAMALRAETIRIQAPIPGKNVVGIEIPNDSFETIYLRDILESELFLTSKSLLTIAMGKDIVGNPFVTDLKKLPHLLIAGTTGSRKSVGINAMILSLLYRNDPDNLKLMLIDLKMLEFSIYSEEEIEEIVEFLKEQRVPDYDERYSISEDGRALGVGVVGDLDALYEQAKEIVITEQKTSISYLQRKLQIGYNRSANIIEQMQEMGVLSSPNNKGQREIII